MLWNLTAEDWKDVRLALAFVFTFPVMFGLMLFFAWLGHLSKRWWPPKA